jgi:RNA polymerase sigma factor (sigma-70 family)
LEQRVFELFYWENRSPAEMVDLLTGFGPLTLIDVLNALDRVEAALTQRQRAELVAMTARARKPVSLDASEDEADRPFDIADPAATPEEHVHRQEVSGFIDRALAALPASEAVILRLKYMEGLSLQQIRQALHLDELTEQHVRSIVQKLKGVLGHVSVPVTQRS